MVSGHQGNSPHLFWLQPTWSDCMLLSYFSFSPYFEFPFLCHNSIAHIPRVTLFSFLLVVLFIFSCNSFVCPRARCMGTRRNYSFTCCGTGLNNAHCPQESSTHENSILTARQQLRVFFVICSATGLSVHSKTTLNAHTKTESVVRNNQKAGSVRCGSLFCPPIYTPVIWFKTIKKNTWSNWFLLQNDSSEKSKKNGIR